MPEATKPQAAAPNFVLSLLAACSSSVPVAGKEGEATLKEQLLGLLQEKAMDVGELNLIYSYKFGLSIEDALKFIGFDEKLEDFAIKQKCFSIREGLISLTPVDVPVHDEPAVVDEPVADYEITAVDKPVAVDEPAAVDEPVAPEGGAEESNEEATGSQRAKTIAKYKNGGSSLDCDSDVDISGWHGVGSRLVAALGSPKQDCLETASIASDESTDEGQSDAESDIDISGWHSVGSRLIAALQDDDDDERVDVHGWHDVSCRIASACKSCHDDDYSAQDPSPDVSQWRGVGVRVLKCLEDPDEVDEV